MSQLMSKTRPSQSKDNELFFHVTEQTRIANYGINFGQLLSYSYTVRGKTLRAATSENKNEHSRSVSKRPSIRIFSLYLVYASDTEFYTRLNWLQSETARKFNVSLDLTVRKLLAPAACAYSEDHTHVFGEEFCRQFSSSF